MSTKSTDPVTFSVILHRFASTVDEMIHTVEHTAWTSILALCRDLSCAIYDRTPRQISMGEGLPIQTTSMDLVLREVQRAFGDEIYDGDIFLCNDPYRYNTHIGDLVTACPVFVDGRHIFWSVTRGHQLDTGAMLPSSLVASAENVWQEGITIPPLKLYERGHPRRDVVELYLANVRYRDALYGDLLAQIGSIEKGRQRLVELCEEHGADEVLLYVEAMLDYAARRTSEGIASMPDGEYFGEGWIDDDGFDEVDIPIKVKVTIAGDRVTVDTSGSAPQVRGGVNGSFATAHAAATCPILYCIDEDIPHNQGCISHVEVIAPEGTICNAKYPASTSLATIVPSDMIQDAVGKALSQAIPERVMAGSVRAANIPTFSGIDGETQEEWAVMIFNGAGGSGAAKEMDGWPVFDSVAAFGGMKFASVEETELLYPLRLEQMEIEPESMGLGKWNGGPGVRLVVRPIRGAMESVTFGDSYRNPPHGVLGGTPGIGGGHYVEDPRSGKRRFGSAASHLQVESHEVWCGVSTGGGGYGSPLERDAEQVRRDVRDDIVTRETAQTVFGVVVSDDLDPQLDAHATEQMRASLAKEPRPPVDPQQRGAGTWREQVMRDGDEYVGSSSR